MPFVELSDAVAMCYRCDSTRMNTISTWMDEILPRLAPPAQITLLPMWTAPNAEDADWPADTRVLGVRYRFRAGNGTEGIAELEKLRAALSDALRLPPKDLIVRVGKIAREGAGHPW